MKTITKDIIRTLFIKIILLFTLWFVCVKNITSLPTNTKTWFFGASQGLKVQVIKE